MYRKIGLIVAMDKEFAQFEALLTHKRSVPIAHGELVVGYIGEKEVALQRCGIGKVNAAIGTMLLIEAFQPDLILSSGCAGGASVALHMGDVVVAAQCAYHDVYCGVDCSYGQVMGMPVRYEAATELVQTACSMSTDERRVVGGLTVTGDWFVDDRQTMRRILERFPDALAVDMESCAIAQTAYAMQVPFLSFRIISDVPLSDTKAQQYYDFWDRLADGSFHIIRHYLEKI